MRRIVALIPAAGYSSRMGFFKPLQSMQSLLLIEKPIAAFREAGIEDIRVIVGYKKELLRPVLSRLGVGIIENLNFNQGMFSSVRCGVMTLEEEVEAFFLLPGDYPCVKAETIKQLLTAYEQEAGEVIYPCFKGDRGHPPLISTKFRPAILSSQVNGTLCSVLESRVGVDRAIAVNDPGILLDMDTGSDYKLLQEPGGMADYPVQEDCMAFLQEAGVSKGVVLHAQVVARIAGVMAEHLNSEGCHLNLGLVLAGALLHDVAKGEANHALRGKEMIALRGYQEVAQIVGVHMDITHEADEPLNEAAIVYLADKLVQGNKIVSLEERFSHALAQGEHEDILWKVRKRLADAKAIKGKIETVARQQFDYISN